MRLLAKIINEEMRHFSRRLARIGMMTIALAAAFLLATILSKPFGDDVATALIFPSMVVIFLSELWICDRIFGWPVFSWRRHRSSQRTK